MTVTSTRATFDFAGYEARGCVDATVLRVRRDGDPRDYAIPVLASFWLAPRRRFFIEMSADPLVRSFLLRLIEEAFAQQPFLVATVRWRHGSEE